MKAFKMFNKDMTCTKGRGVFQYEIGQRYYEEEATCAKTGFHAAENPLDCLTYYHDFANAICCEVDAGGSIDEDDKDSKISCTMITILRQLDLEEFLTEAVMYIVHHPQMPMNHRVKTEPAAAGKDHFVIVRSTDPAGKGKAGDYVCLIKEDSGGRIVDAGIFRIEEDQEDKWIDVYGEVTDEKGGSTEA